MEKMNAQRGTAFLLFLWAVFLCSSWCLAGDGFFKYGVGLVQNQTNIAEVKLFSVGYQDHISKIVVYQAEAGLWADSMNNGGSRKSSGWVSGSAGIEVTPGPLYLQSLWGIAAIT